MGGENEEVKEYLLDNNRVGTDGSEYQEMLQRAEKTQKVTDKATALADAAQAALELASHKKEVVGTPVTVESFEIWKRAFDLENVVVHTIVSITNTRACGVDGQPKISGRELWQLGQIKTGEDEEELEDEDDEEKEDEDEASDEEEVDTMTDPSLLSMEKAKLSY